MAAAAHIQHFEGEGVSDPGWYFTFDENPDPDSGAWDGPYGSLPACQDAATEAIQAAAVEAVTALFT